MSLIPLIRLSMSKCYTFLTTFISLNKEIINPYSHYVKKGLVYIIIINPFSRQPSSCTKCTKLNTCTLYNMRLISFNKYTFFYYTRYYAY